MATTYTPIATYTASGTISDYTFSSISGTYTDLVLVTSLKMVTGTPETRIRFNSDTGANYSYTILWGSGSSAGSTRNTGATGVDISYYGVPNTTEGNSVQITNIQNYSNTTTNKTTLSRANNASIGVDAIAGLWRSTAAITSITIYPNSSSFASGSVFTLYGIKAA